LGKFKLIFSDLLTFPTLSNLWFFFGDYLLAYERPGRISKFRAV